MKLDPYAYMQDSTSRDTSNPANWNNANFEPIGHNLFVCNSDAPSCTLSFQLYQSTQQGLIYDSDYRIALYIDDFPVIDYDTLIAAGPDSRYEPLFQSFAGLATGGRIKFQNLTPG